MSKLNVTVANLPRDVRKEFPPGARLVETPKMLSFVANALRAAKDGRITAADGLAGSGKSVSVAVAQVVVARKFPTIRMHVGQRRTSRQTIAQFHQLVSGSAQPPAGTRTVLERQLEQMLAGKPYGVFVDEAQKAGIDALEAMRTVHGHMDAVWGMILSGAGLFRLLESQPYQMLLSRARRGRLVPFEPMKPAQVIPYMSRFHPVWETTSQARPWLLHRIDRVYAAGTWRDWAGVTDEVLTAWDGTSAITEAQAHDAVGRLLTVTSVDGWDEYSDGRFDDRKSA